MGQCPTFCDGFSFPSIGLRSYPIDLTLAKVRRMGQPPSHPIQAKNRREWDTLNLSPVLRTNAEIHSARKGRGPQDDSAVDSTAVDPMSRKCGETLRLHSGQAMGHPIRCRSTAKSKAADRSVRPTWAKIPYFWPASDEGSIVLRAVTMRARSFAPPEKRLRSG